MCFSKPKAPPPPIPMQALKEPSVNLDVLRQRRAATSQTPGMGSLLSSTTPATLTGLLGTTSLLGQ